ncbi:MULTISPECIES: sensor histidine kinase [Streptomyces]|uniref:sensor histidine kinase n=1 Tax=Streptomyces TaxID=1883 RepID=UPI001409D61E|nr:MULTISPECIES: sensor histidine kinase [Streptomyces]MDH6229207.1 signal transduction histidine kinase [Streptomyces sp. MJP52]
MTESIQSPWFWAFLVVLAIVLAAVAVIRGQRGRLAVLHEETRRLEARNAELEDDHAKSLREAREQAEEDTKTVLKSAMRTLQGLAAEQQLVLSRLQTKHGDSPIFEDLLEADHTNAQFGRRALSIAVLCDGWLGGRRDPASVYDVVRSAQGRIRHFRRVEILSQVDYRVVGRAVEPVALALSELLANATSYSSPDTVVEINIRSVPKGVCIVVDDAGVGMSDEERARAEKLLSTERATGVAGLGNPPQFGFAVIGVLAEKFGFEVAVDSSSPYGGVRAVILLPHDLLTSMPERKMPARPVAPAATQPAPAADTRPPSTAVPAAELGGPEPAADPVVGAHGLPQRRRKRPMTIVRDDSATAPRAPERSDTEKAAIMGAFQRGTQSGRATQPSPGGNTSGTRTTSSEGHEES